MNQQKSKLQAELLTTCEVQDDTVMSDSDGTSNVKEMEKSPLKLQRSTRTINKPKYLEDFTMLALNANMHTSRIYSKALMTSEEKTTRNIDTELWIRKSRVLRRILPEF